MFDQLTPDSLTIIASYLAAVIQLHICVTVPLLPLRKSSHQSSGSRRRQASAASFLAEEGASTCAAQSLSELRSTSKASANSNTVRQTHSPSGQGKARSAETSPGCVQQGGPSYEVPPPRSWTGGCWTWTSCSTWPVGTNLPQPILH